MKIWVTGTIDRLNEFRKITADSKAVTYSEYSEASGNAPLKIDDFEIIADLNLDEQPERINLYSSFRNKIVLGCAVKKSLKEIASFSKQNLQCFPVGFNSLPTFIDRTKKEVSFLTAESKQSFAIIAEKLNWEWLEVKDTVGMVTPRIIMMLINEACFTLDEGTASRQDIDTGMKLGTAYPFGPLEWSDRIGIKNVFETLSAIQKCENESRYSISPLLKASYLNNNTFTGSLI